MGLMTGLKANKAYRLQKNGQTEEAIKIYEEAFAEGLNDPRYVLSYALLIIRKGEYQKAKDFLVKHQKAPGMTPDQRVTLLVDYAACCFRLGDIDKGINTLEQQHRKGETGLIYQTLGYLYVEKYDAAHKPEFPPEEEGAETGETAVTEEPEETAEAAEEPAETAEKTAEDSASGEAEPAQQPDEETKQEAAADEKVLSPREAWDAGVEKAEAFIKASLEYDDEDPICLDNMGQFLYRVREDRAGAKEWFEKALAIKDSQIDTLYFLSRYDEEAGDHQAALEKLEKAVVGRFSPLNYCRKEEVEKEILRLKGVN
jgi:tetratricopeptide (TPR) repeat protein